MAYLHISLDDGKRIDAINHFFVFGGAMHWADKRRHNQIGRVGYACMHLAEYKSF